ncbi:LytTR family DNA-binding domain-containing protein [soil metagenome]
MSFRLDVISILRKPFPRAESSSRRWLGVLGVSSFVALFLLAFAPFGLSATFPNRTLIIAGYGLVTSLCMGFLVSVPPFLLPNAFAEERWTVGKEILMMMLTISLIGVGNTMYTWWVFNYNLSLELFLVFQGVTLLVGSIPASFIVILQYQRYQMLFVRGAREIESHMHAPTTHDTRTTIRLEDDEGRNVIELGVDELVVLSAADNYVQVIWRQGGESKQQLLRTSLKGIELRHTLPLSWFRCHRSHIVNLNAVEHVRGNAQGYRLQCGEDVDVAVARSKSVELRRRMSERH